MAPAVFARITRGLPSGRHSITATAMLTGFAGGSTSTTRAAHIEFRPTLQHQRDDAAAKGQTSRQHLFDELSTGSTTTKSTQVGIEFMLARRGYQPWALVFDRQSIYDAGGGPVWYARPDQYTALGMIDPGLRSWAVRLDPGSDWLEEQEWRIVLPARTDGFIPVVPLTTLRLVAIIVGDPFWTGAAQRGHNWHGTSQRGWFYPPLPPGLPRWWWKADTAKLESLNPLF